MKLFVGNLPWSVDLEGLKKIFEGFEVAEATIISDKFSGRSKGFGFVTIEDEEAAKKAIESLHERELEGRKITVNEARPMDPDRPRPPRRNFGGGGGFKRRF